MISNKVKHYFLNNFVENVASGDQIERERVHVTW